MWAVVVGRRQSVGARAWLLQPSGLRLKCGVDGDWGAAVPVSEVRPHHEPIARLAASVAVVCGDGHRGSALSARDSEGDSTRDRREMWTRR